MTSNLGSQVIGERIATEFGKNGERWERVFGELKKDLLRLLKQTIRPEFLNRIDEIIVFRPLGSAEIRRVVDLQLRRVITLAAGRGITLEVTDEARDWLARLGYDPMFGARPLKRVIQKHLVNPLSERILAGDFGEGDRVEVGLDSTGMLEFARRAGGPPGR
jgi:ATP-dependent Clp protease ATP-binding subunit ClpB